MIVSLPNKTVLYQYQQQKNLSQRPNFIVLGRWFWNFFLSFKSWDSMWFPGRLATNLFAIFTPKLVECTSRVVRCCKPGYRSTSNQFCELHKSDWIVISPNKIVENSKKTSLKANDLCLCAFFRRSPFKKSLGKKLRDPPTAEHHAVALRWSGRPGEQNNGCAMIINEHRWLENHHFSIGSIHRLGVGTVIQWLRKDSERQLPNL